VEGLIGGTGNDRLVGDAHGNRLWGASGDDTLIGNGGGAGAVGFVPDELVGHEGYDLLDGGPAGSSFDKLDGGAGIDTVTYEYRSDPVKVSLDPALELGEDTIANVENAKGGSSYDLLLGNDGPNWLSGNKGGDSIDGRGGNDVLHGNDGDDNIEGGVGNDVVGGAVGDDNLSGGPGGDHIRGHDGIDTVTYAGYVLPIVVTLADDEYNDGYAGEGDKVLADVENVIGGSNSDTITGSVFNNLIWGGGGNDSLFGLDGYDLLGGQTGVDKADGGASIDTCLAEQFANCEK
jgi:Ca2+-binding RTX toxin-like protein